MIWIIYRNIGEDKPNPAYTAYQLGFGDFINDSTFSKWSGEASLGGGGILNVNNGKTIDLGWFGLVSGINVMGAYNGLSWVKSVTIHEYGHHLLGGGEAHLQTGVWGIMHGYGRRCQVVNPYERHKLGWINLIQYNYNPLLPFPLGDYVTTGDALRIQVPGASNQYYLVTNHQRISPLDNIDRTSDGKGVYVLLQNGRNNLDLYFFNAEGRALWTFDHYAIHPTVGVNVPVFRKGAQNNSSGKFDTDAIPFGASRSAPIEAYVNLITGLDVFEPLFAGDGKDMMKPNYVEVFSPWSNPSLNSVGFQVILNNNQIKIIQKVESGTQISLPPSKPQNLKIKATTNYNPKLIWETNLEPDVLRYKIYRSFPLGNYDEIVTVSHNPNLNQHSYIDYQVTIAQPNGITGMDANYKIKAEDNQQLLSVFSNDVSVTTSSHLHYKVSTNKTKIPTEYLLEQNYPNPFNPITVISWQLPIEGWVTLKVFDILGREVATLINENKKIGVYEAEFNASLLSNGIYFYSLQTGSFSYVRKMIVMK